MKGYLNHEKQSLMHSMGQQGWVMMMSTNCCNEQGKKLQCEMSRRQ